MYKDVNLSDNDLIFPTSNCQNTLTYQNNYALFQMQLGIDFGSRPGKFEELVEPVFSRFTTTVSCLNS